MIDGREPNYICLDTRALKLVRRLSDSERLVFFDGLYSIYLDKLTGNESFFFPDTMAGELLRQAAQTLIVGFDTYMKRVNANSDWRNSLTDHKQVNDQQSNQDQINKDQYNQDQINQIKMQLKAEGYSGSEIDKAFARSEGKRVKNLISYIRQSINNERQEYRTGKRVPAQEYSQRDYTFDYRR